MNTDRIIGLSAMLISLLTLLIFIYQTNIIRKQSRLSVTPRLSFNTSINFDKDSLITFSSVLSNKGLGPAIIESIQIIDKGKKYEMDWEHFFDKAYPQLNELGRFPQLNTIKEGDSMTANERKTLFSYQFPAKKLTQLNQYMNISEDDRLPFVIYVEYSSIYEECWKTNTQDMGHPKKIK